MRNAPSLPDPLERVTCCHCRVSLPRMLMVELPDANPRCKNLDACAIRRRRLPEPTPPATPVAATAPDRPRNQKTRRKKMNPDGTYEDA